MSSRSFPSPAFFILRDGKTDAIIGIRVGRFAMKHFDNYHHLWADGGLYIWGVLDA